MKPGVTAKAAIYSVGEEIAHAITHGVGVVAGIVGLVILVAYSVKNGDTWHVVGCSIFGGTLILMYTASTLYHSIPLPRAKAVLRIIDHSSIYLLIAGSYTPFTLTVLRGDLGWTLFTIVWTLAAIGVVFKIFATGRYEKLSLFIYLGMGWVAIVAIKPFIQAVELGGIILMVAGGLAYTVGVIFYVWERLPYHHAIWHVFVLTGSVLHYFAVLFYVVPPSPVVAPAG